MQKTVLTHEEMIDLAGMFVCNLKPFASYATVVTLAGDLGAGKTTFTQGVARSLGVEETVSSPTFVIEKIYDLQGQVFQRLIHIDAFRLKGEFELEALGWREINADSGNLILLEWPERVPGLVPEVAIKLQFDIQGDARIITIDGQESGSEST
jgi:tRNA threonylcarbamoyladenosine biosynthesis protein TsaE